MQTFNNKLKDKQTLTAPITKSSQASQGMADSLHNPFSFILNGSNSHYSYLWFFIITSQSKASKSILWDAQNNRDEQFVTETESNEEIALNVNQSTLSNEKSGTTSALGKSSASATPLVKRTENADQDAQEVYHKQVLASAELKRALMLHERIISQNNYQRKVAQFRSFDQLDRTTGLLVKEEEGEEMRLARLWSFQSSITKSMAVTQVAWNKVNPDIIAVAYAPNPGNTRVQNKGYKGNKVKPATDGAGLVCCWNLKNLDYPERVYHTQSSALCVSFRFVFVSKRSQIQFILVKQRQTYSQSVFITELRSFIMLRGTRQQWQLIRTIPLESMVVRSGLLSGSSVSAVGMSEAKSWSPFRTTVASSSGQCARASSRSTWWRSRYTQIYIILPNLI